jgi:hypothetical protein
VLAGLKKEADLTEEDTEDETEADTEAETETETESEAEEGAGFLTLLRAGMPSGRTPLFDLFSE